ncbi:MAG TPA: hypothetical protein PKO15_02935 [Fibrobacteria bacterium]|nr:hypothetical protein [Fibrobacteria bacterium]HOX52438.1 hypothetical protein [Fibrobacteria bacterium]
MKAFISFFRFLSIPAIAVGAACIWLGARDWKVATVEATANGKTIFANGTPGVVKFRDSVRFDLWHASLREESFMGMLQPVRAVYPAWVGKDSSEPRLVVVSSAPEVVGPTVYSFLHPDSSRGDLTVSANDGSDEGNLKPKFSAILQQLAFKHAKHLKDTAWGWRWVEGVAVLQTDPDRVGINPIAPKYWEIITEDIPTRDNVTAKLGGGFVLVVVGAFLHISIGRADRKRKEEEEEESQNEKPLV